MPGGEETDDTEHGAALSKHLTFRIDPAMAQSLAVRAMAEGVGGRKNLSRLYRVLLRAGLAGGWHDGLDKTLTEIKRLRADLARVGGNLNQVALWLNAQDHLKEKELVAAIDALRPPLKKCTEAVTELRDGIIRRTR